AQAAALYAGPFLDDFYVADSDLLEDWMVTTRERLHQQMLTALSKLTEQQETQGKWDNALASVRRLLALAPWQEEAHCQLMRLLARSGQRSAALAQYDTLTQMLMDELGVSPAPETDAL
ncbi:MAG: bacterial transcriptional activator domain-containing protein, partial [Caldilineaceae bacterium]|nr:bacterial transcriptional activator domain-containing protein [Caldilineaceae bacterium]